MSKIYPTEEAKEIQDVCYTLYNGGGVQAVIDYANIINLGYSICTECNAIMPIIETENGATCAVCGGIIEEKEEKEFLIEIQETYTKVVKVKATDKEEALYYAENMWGAEQYKEVHSEFSEVTFHNSEDLEEK